MKGFTIKTNALGLSFESFNPKKNIIKKPK